MLHTSRSAGGRTTLLWAVGLAACLLGTGCAAEGGSVAEPTPEPTHEPTPEPTPEPTAEPTSPSGDSALWQLRAGQEVTAGTRVLRVRVTRLGCSSGRTGRVLPPEVELGATVMVTFEVAPRITSGRCPSNPWVTAEVDLGEPLGARPVFDGACRGEAAGTSWCTHRDGVRVPAPRA